MRLLLLFLEFLFILFLEPFLLLREPPTEVFVSELPPLPSAGASGSAVVLIHYLHYLCGADSLPPLPSAPALFFAPALFLLLHYC